MRRRFLPAALSLALVFAAAPVPAEQVIREIPFVRKVALTVPRTYTFRFSLWDAEDPVDDAGTMVWSEEETIDLTVKKISHDLGSVESLDGVGFSRTILPPGGRLGARGPGGPGCARRDEEQGGRGARGRKMAPRLPAEGRLQAVRTAGWEFPLPSRGAARDHHRGRREPAGTKVLKISISG